MGERKKSNQKKDGFGLFEVIVFAKQDSNGCYSFVP